MLRSAQRAAAGGATALYNVSSPSARPAFTEWGMIPPPVPLPELQK